MGRHVAWGLAVAALLFYHFGTVGGMASQRDRDITASSKAALVGHPALVRERAKLQQVEQAHAQLAASFARTSARLRQALAVGERTDTVEVLREIAVADSTAYAECSVALVACQQRAANAEAEAERLTAQLTAQLTVGRCKLLFLPCPSRGLAFVGGLAVGAVVSGALR